MAFLTPIFLLGLFAALIPIAIHLIRKEKPPKIMFSSIRFLKKTSKKLILFQQIQQWLLLLLRGVVIALIVIAFARPLLGPSISRLLDADPESVVILLDVSMSMRYGGHFDAAKQQALDILEGLSNSDEAALISFSDSVENLIELTSDIESLKLQLANTEQAGFAGTNYMANLRLADQLLLSARFDSKTVYLISDFQAQAFEMNDAAWKLAPGVAFTGIDVGEAESSNLVLTEVRSPTQLLENVEQQEILARVRSTGSVHLNQAQVTLSIDGQQVDTVQVDLTDQSEQVVSLNAVFETNGSHVGEVRVSGDNFSDDNSYYFIVDVLPKINVLIVNGESSDNWFDDEAHWFNLALSSAADSAFSTDTIEPRQLDAALLQRSDVVALLNVGDLNSNQAAAIGRYVKAGGSLLIAPGDRVDPQQFNRLFAEVSPAQLQRPAYNEDGYLLIADYDRRHPILRPLDVDWSVRFLNHWALQPSEQADVLMQFDDATAAMVEMQVDQGRVILLASALDLEWNNLPLQGLFLPFVHETLRHLARPPNRQRQFNIGDSFSLQQGISSAQISAIGADSRPIEFSGENYLIEAREPGFIQASIGNETSTYAVNIIAKESALAKIAVANIYDAIINPDTQPAISNQLQSQQLIAELEGPQRIWWWLLCAVMLLVLVESLIANRTYR